MAGCAELTDEAGAPQPLAPTESARPAPDRMAVAQTVAAPSDEAGCKTVKLFDPVRPKMHRDAPDHLKPWLGHWGPGLWDGKLCHELVVEEIRADGTARIADLQGYYLPWDRWPTAFRREATFREDGTLEVRQGRMGVSVYTLRDGVLHGAYSWGGDPLRVTLARKR